MEDKIYIDGDFNDGYESRVRRSRGDIKPNSMEETKHTPGPWEAVAYGSQYQIESKELVLGLVYGTDDAILIAQAPDLLAKVSEQSQRIKKLEELLNDVLNDVQYADHKIDKDLRNEIKAALGI